jgi:hypothetical protein
MKKLIAGAVLAVTVVGAPVASVFAGEITGNGKPTPVNGYVMKSICAFSGQNDVPDDPIEGGRVQNWGIIPKEIRDQLAAAGEHPGDACNGHTGFLAGGGEEG